VNGDSPFLVDGVKIRTDWADPPLPTHLTWNPRVYSRVRKPTHRGALIGLLWGVPVDGHACGRAAVYQLKTLIGEVRTVWWDGTMYGDSPYLLDVDTDERVLRNPASIAWFCRFEDVRNLDMNTEKEERK
jgi:hypothetical protein